MAYMQGLGQNAKNASKQLATATTKQKNEMLATISHALIENTDIIVEKNRLDLEEARKNNMSASLQDRLMLNKQRIDEIATACLKLIDLPDPIGGILRGFVLPNGLEVKQVRVPLGVVGMIFEARPNVTVDAAAICVKTGNAVILRGGKEAFNTNIVLTNIMKKAIFNYGFNPNCIQLVEDTSRQVATEMMQLNDYLDVLIPRGGSGLINAVKQTATVPVIETGVGVCHIFVDQSADLSRAAEIIHNAKTQRPSTCNACECILIHKSIAKSFLPMVKVALDKNDVVLFGCEETKRILGDCVTLATEDHYKTEYNDYKLSVKVVLNVDEAIAHIDLFSTHHSDSILTNNLGNVDKFVKHVDSACVYVNASTRFTDGGEFGFGAEIGISTQKLHARGPMGLLEMTSSKYIITGQGQIR